MAHSLTHVDASGTPRMVDVSEKALTRRSATAETRMTLPPEIMAVLENGELHTKKGPVFHTAIIAGIQGVKRTAELIPFCHTLLIEHSHIDIIVKHNQLCITCEVATTGKTGVEMEALTGATIAALTVYDMVKALSQDIEIAQVRLVQKSGGKQDIDKRTARTA